MHSLLAMFVGPYTSWGIGELLIALVIICGAVAIAVIALRKLNIPVPEWFKQMLWVVVIVVVAVVLIRFVLSL